MAAESCRGNVPPSEWGKCWAMEPASNKWLFLCLCMTRSFCLLPSCHMFCVTQASPSLFILIILLLHTLSCPLGWWIWPKKWQKRPYQSSVWKLWSWECILSCYSSMCHTWCLKSVPPLKFKCLCFSIVALLLLYLRPLCLFYQMGKCIWERRLLYVDST